MPLDWNLLATNLRVLEEELKYPPPVPSAPTGHPEATQEWRGLVHSRRNLGAYRANLTELYKALDDIGALVWEERKRILTKGASVECDLQDKLAAERRLEELRKELDRVSTTGRRRDHNQDNEQLECITELREALSQLVSIQDQIVAQKAHAEDCAKALDLREEQLASREQSIHAAMQDIEQRSVVLEGLGNVCAQHQCGDVPPISQGKTCPNQDRWEAVLTDREKRVACYLGHAEEVWSSDGAGSEASECVMSLHAQGYLSRAEDGWSSDEPPSDWTDSGSRGSDDTIGVTTFGVDFLGRDEQMPEDEEEPRGDGQQLLQRSDMFSSPADTYMRRAEVLAPCGAFVAGSSDESGLDESELVLVRRYVDPEDPPTKNDHGPEI